MTDAQEPVTPPVTSHVPAPYGANGMVVRSRTLGRIALAAGVTLFVISIVVSIGMGIAAAPHVVIGPNGFNAYFSANDPDPAVRALAIASALHIFVGALIGIWVIVQGIVAAATGRGRAEGVIAIVLGVVTPLVSLGVYIGTLFANA